MKRGKYSQNLPEGLLTAYQNALQDPVLIGLQDEIALVDTRLEELSARLPHTQSSGVTFKRALDLCTKAFFNVDKSEQPLHSMLTRLLDLLEKGQCTENTWDQMISLIEQRRRCAETESKRIVSMNQAIPVKKVMEMLELISQSVRQHVMTHADSTTSANILRGVHNDATRLIGSGVLPITVSRSGTGDGPTEEDLLKG